MLLELAVYGGFEFAASTLYVSNVRSVPNVRKQLGFPIARKFDKEKGCSYLLFKKPLWSNINTRKRIEVFTDLWMHRLSFQLTRNRVSF